jgi:opine dehydrogenase
MMRLAVLGAGAIGPAAAVLAVSRGHQAVMWSPSGKGTVGIAGTMHAEGVLEGAFLIEVAATLEDAFRGADAALLVVPAYAYGNVLPRIAAALPPDLPLLVAPAASLAPVVLDVMMARRGAPKRRAPIGAMGTTTGGARRLAPDRVRVAMVRTALEMAAVPASAAPEMARLAHELFGMEFPLSPDALHVSFINVNPIAHSVLALTNVTRMERGEDWPQYSMMTPFACDLMLALAKERAKVAAAYGHTLDGIDTFFHRANQVPMGPLHEMTAKIAAARSDIRGPKTTDSRYVTEDVPYGLSYYIAVGVPKGIALPVTDSAVRMLEVLWGRDLRANPMLEALDLAELPHLLREGAGRG